MSDRSYEGTELELFAGATTWKRYTATRLRPWLRGDVLEVGAGLGATTASLYHSGVQSWTALEPDRDLVAAAKVALQRSALVGPEVQAGMLIDLPTGPNFDTIVYVDVLEHIEDDVEEVVQAAARLRPGGRLVVLSPAHQWLFSPFDESIGHYRRYNRRQIRALTPPDLRLRSCQYIDAAGLLVSASNRLLLRSAMPTAGQIRLWDRVLVPISRCLDPLLGRRAGKSIIAVWERIDATH